MLPLLALIPRVPFVLMSSQLSFLRPGIVPHCFRARGHPARIAHSEPRGLGAGASIGLPLSPEGGRVRDRVGYPYA
jgi:cyanophycinase-like exopeptidase